MEGLNVDFFLIIWVVWIVCAIASGHIAGEKGYSHLAFGLLGLILGIIGVIIALVLPEKKTGYDRRIGNPDALLKYKELLDKGAITQEEFDRKKNELMW